MVLRISRYDIMCWTRFYRFYASICLLWIASPRDKECIWYNTTTVLVLEDKTEYISREYCHHCIQSHSFQTNVCLKKKLVKNKYCDCVSNFRLDKYFLKVFRMSSEMIERHLWKSFSDILLMHLQQYYRLPKLFQVVHHSIVTSIHMYQVDWKMKLKSFRRYLQ